MALSEWLNPDKWLAIKNKFNAVITLLQGGYIGQVFTSNGGGDPSWQDITISHADTADYATLAGTADLATVSEGLNSQDSTGTVIFIKQLLLPTWNMDANDSAVLDLELELDEALIDYKILIINDSLSLIKNLEGSSAGGEADGYIEYNPSTKIMTLYRTPAELFDSTDYDSTASPRGYATITYARTI